MGITLRELLQLEALEDLAITGGIMGIDNQVSSVMTLDNPEMVKWMKEGELLLTTGYLFKENADIGIALIQDLSANGCSGLGVKVKRYLTRIPDFMIEEANRLNFPLIEIPFYVSLSDLTEIIIKKIYNKKMFFLEESDEALNELMDIILEQGSLEDILNFGEGLFHCPLILVDINWNLIAYSRSNLEDMFNIKKGMPVFIPDVETRLNQSIINKEFSTNITVKDSHYYASTHEVTAGYSKIGYLIAFYSNLEQLKQNNPFALDKYLRVISLFYLSEKAVSDQISKERIGFFNRLLDGSFDTIEEMQDRSNAYNLDPKKKYICIVIQFEKYHKISDPLLSFLTKKSEISNRKLHERIQILTGKTSHFVIRNNILVSILELYCTDDYDSAEEEAQTFSRAMKKVIDTEDLFENYQIGIGLMANNALEITASFEEALHSAKMLNDMNGISSYKNHIFYFMLLKYPRERKVLIHTLGPLIDYDLNNHSELIKTLEKLIDCQFNHSKAAKQLFIHRNTLEYRIEKIKDLLNTDFGDADELRDYQLGIKAIHIESLSK